SFIPSAEQTGHGPVRRLLMAPDATAALLDLCFNDPVLFRAVEAITGCAALRFFAGSVYRLTAARGDVPWHDDCVDGRRVAMTMTLAPEAYDGGVLQLRERDGHEIRDVPNPGPGDAILFRIHPSLQHRNTPLTSGTKTAFAGWFGDGPSLARRLRSATAEGVQ
ncbi:MAG TPA: 2OG-Fe(II) oxygenase, partial [Vicinamibacterales bacterium]|nr:2OG-Fe(II) oxygenase [Vicinamibacterales bacterium]